MSDDENTLRIEVSGMPHPQPRPRHVTRQGMVSTMGPRVKAWRMRVAAAIDGAVANVGEAVIERFHDGALGLELLFRVPVTAKHAHWVGLAHHTDPDADNLAKPMMDELQNRKVVPNDGRIAELAVRKVWCRPEDGGCVMTLRRLASPRVGLGLTGQGERPEWLQSGEDGA